MSEVVNVSEIFGKNVFNEVVMKERLPKNVFKKLKKTIEDEQNRCICRRSGTCHERMGD